MTPFLENNLGLTYPFVDGTTDPIISALADILVIGPRGPYTVQILNPGYPSITTSFQLRISGPDGVFLDTTGGATVVTLGAFTYVAVTDGTTGAQARLIFGTAALATAIPLGTPAGLVISVIQETLTGLRSLNAVTGDVTVSLPNYCRLNQAATGAQIDFLDPADRYVCPDTTADALRGLAGAQADATGALHIDAGQCYRLQAVPGTPGLLRLYNFCKPCVDCDDVATVETKLISQADYFHHLAAIHVDQFNRYQTTVAAVNAKITDVEAGSDVSVDTGLVTFVGRVFNRPYFNQVYVAVVNNTSNRVSIALTMSITDPAVASQLATVPGSLLVTKTMSGGVPFSNFAGFPGTVTFTLEPQDSVGFNAELQRMSVTSGAPVTAQWALNAVVTFVGGPTPLPSPVTVTKTLYPPISLFGAPLSSVS